MGWDREYDRRNDQDRTGALPQDVMQVLERGGTVVAANARAARSLRQAYAARMRDEGRQAWPVPAIHDWAGWVDGLYREAAEIAALPVVLNAMQEAQLWRAAAGRDADLVVSPEQLAELAADAYGLLSDYDAQADRRAPWADAHEDAAAFLRWADAFDEACVDLDVTPRARIAGLLADWCAGTPEWAGAAWAPNELLLVGFDRVLPAQVRLLRALGVPYRSPESIGPAERSELVVAPDAAQELAACAWWARGLLEQDGKRRIGILLPQAGASKAQLDRVLRRVLQPGSAAGDAEQAPLYEFSLGIPLAQVPVVASALHLLRWMDGPVTAATVTSLLTSGLIAASADEALRLAVCDGVLRRRGLLDAEVSLMALVQGGARCLPEPVRARLQACSEWAAREKGRRRLHAEWAGIAEQQLEAAGWPGYRAAGSTEFQARQRWTGLLAEAATLGFRGERVRWRDFVRDVEVAAANTLFAAESLDAPVQVLGVAEASGQQFDAIWVLEATEDNWPAAGSVHPLLAPGVQRERGMPHASHGLDLQLAREQMERVLRSAPVVVASYAAQKDGQEQRPSPLVRMFGEARPVTTASPLATVACAVERVAEADAVRPWDTARVAGGSEVLKRQSACGFQGFAVKRLGAAGLESERWGPDARERGDLLHKSLEQLWLAEPVSAEAVTDGNPDPGRLRGSGDLHLSAEDGSLEIKVRAAVDRALARALDEADRAGDAWEGTYLRLEADRIVIRLLFWLECELKREPFKVIALEREVKDAHVGPLALNLRVDRVDRFDNGRSFVMDYKTGAGLSAKQWLGERPEEPQLPIYARFGVQAGGLGEVAGIGFGQIRTGATRLISMGEPGDGITRRRPVLDDAQREAWDNALTALASDFAAGVAAVNPRDLETTCARCGLFGVCRVRSQGDATLMRLEAADGDDGAGEMADA